jgi:hypothetical protein
MLLKLRLINAGDGVAIDAATSYIASVSGVYTSFRLQICWLFGYFITYPVTINLSPTSLPNGQTFICGEQRPELLRLNHPCINGLKMGSDILGLPNAL